MQPTQNEPSVKSKNSNERLPRIGQSVRNNPGINRGVLLTDVDSVSAGMKIEERKTEVSKEKT